MLRERVSCYKPNGRRKADFKTQKQAFTKSQEIQRRAGKYLRPYHCDDCGQWHLSSKKRK